MLGVNLVRYAFLVAAAALPIAAGTPSAGCGKAPKLITAAAASTPLNLTSGGQTRQYYVKLPENYDKDHQYRLILTLHALGGNGQLVTVGQGGYLPWYGMPALINDTTGAIYISPTGLNNGWWNTNGSDVEFIKAAMQAVEEDVCIDQNLRFSTGFSHGGAMSFILACALGKQLRAVGVLSGNPQISGSCPSPGTEPVAYYAEHGVADQVLPITGGRQMRDRFLKNNGCADKTAAEPAKGSGTHIKTQYDCNPGYPVTWVAFDGDHTPQPKDKGASKTFAADYTWEFFSQFK
ncbi:Alpha/Beta hydrolase protein [Echria macrotheca]|uniref:Feruloyl esterase C n=1 Tax=Echria macrotheca TaxID=438768 RepID=A0AAJ0B3H6_9PEZI|nr:Alpha/Beta hydrolase protein [Echria macrotheca]